MSRKTPIPTMMKSKPVMPPGAAATQDSVVQGAKMKPMNAHQKLEIVLFTDPWRSPIHRIASHTLSGRIAVPSAWDSNATLMLLVECVIASVQEMSWETVKDRTDALEQAFDRTRLFRKFT